tara:strand:+ start:17 stop:1054 length:1038 start_codon:yes stop_codon:yes gene_type:complete
MESKKEKVLITGSAGFIGSELCKKMIRNGHHVIGLDSIDDYYSPKLKEARLSEIKKESNNYSGSWIFKKISLEDKQELTKIFINFSPNIVVNLAAQAGVRFSINNPLPYVNSNLVGFVNLLECCKTYKVSNFIYASSSSVYGGNNNYPYKEEQSVNHPVSLYAATKKSNELIAHSYSHLFKIPATGLRYFTVYGPWGRPDMAPMKFTKAILKGEKIQVYNFGKMQRDFTYIDDVIEGTYRCCFKKAFPSDKFDKKNPDPSISFAPHRIFNIGNSKPIELMYFIELIEKALDKKADKDFQPLQPGDVISTSADTEALKKWIGFSPNTSIEKGIKSFVTWYKDFYNF